jgi:hypothetical protein
MKCKICENPISSDPYCQNHKQAEKALKEGFKEWQKAKEIDWDRYIDEIISNDNTGNWVREVAEYLKKNK